MACILLSAETVRPTKMSAQDLLFREPPRTCSWAATLGDPWSIGGKDLFSNSEIRNFATLGNSRRAPSDVTPIKIFKGRDFDVEACGQYFMAV